MAKKKKPEILKQFKHHKLEESTDKTISFSQYSLFKQCPYKWSLQYRDGHYTFSPSIHTIFGTAMHFVIQHYITTIYEKSGVAADKLDLVEIFEKKLKEIYKEEFVKNGSLHITTLDELGEFFQDGIEIIEVIKKDRNTLFGVKGWHLVGVEVPLFIPTKISGIRFKGFLDLILYHEGTETFRIIDFKTSKNSWRDSQKKDETKQFQLILYKYFFAKQFNIPVDNIEVEFIILKRKLWENTEYQQKRTQQFSPPSGKIKLKRAKESFDEFLTTVYNDDATHKQDVFFKNVTKLCSYCPFENGLCDKKNAS